MDFRSRSLIGEAEEEKSGKGTISSGQKSGLLMCCPGFEARRIQLVVAPPENAL
jgi:hypothetical protein